MYQEVDRVDADAELWRREKFRRVENLGSEMAMFHSLGIIDSRLKAERGGGRRARRSRKKKEVAPAEPAER